MTLCQNAAVANRNRSDLAAATTRTLSDHAHEAKSILLIGPDSAARLLEVGVSEAERIEFIVRAVPARDRFLET